MDLALLCTLMRACFGTDQRLRSLEQILLVVRRWRGTEPECPVKPQRWYYNNSRRHCYHFKNVQKSDSTLWLGFTSPWRRLGRRRTSKRQKCMQETDGLTSNIFAPRLSAGATVLLCNSLSVQATTPGSSGTTVHPGSSSLVPSATATAPYTLGRGTRKVQNAFIQAQSTRSRGRGRGRGRACSLAGASQTTIQWTVYTNPYNFPSVNLS